MSVAQLPTLCGPVAELYFNVSCEDGHRRYNDVSAHFPFVSPSSTMSSLTKASLYRKASYQSKARLAHIDNCLVLCEIDTHFTHASFEQTNALRISRTPQFKGQVVNILPSSSMSFPLLTAP